MYNGYQNYDSMQIWNPILGLSWKILEIATKINVDFDSFKLLAKVNFFTTFKKKRIPTIFWVVQQSKSCNFWNFLVNLLFQ